MTYYEVKRDGSLVIHGGRDTPPKGFFVTDKKSEAMTKINKILNDRYGTKKKKNTSTSKDSK